MCESPKGEFVLKLFLFARGQYIHVYEYIINNRCIYILYCIFICQNVSEKEWNNEGKDKSGVHSPSAAFGWIQGIISSSTKSPDQRDNGARVLQSHQLAIIITRHPIHLSRTQSHRIAKGDEHMACLRKTSTSLGGGVIYCNPGDLKQLEIERYTRPTCDSMMIFESMHPFFWAISSKTHQPREVFEHLGRLWRQLNSVTFLTVRAVSQEGECKLLVPRGKKKGKLFYSPNKNGNSNIRVHF